MLIKKEMDPFAYNEAALPGLFPERERFYMERDELREVLMTLRARYGRRRLFRIAEVADAIATVRRYDPPTPVRREIRRLDWNMRDE